MLFTFTFRLSLFLHIVYLFEWARRWFYYFYWYFGQWYLSSSAVPGSLSILFILHLMSAGKCRCHSFFFLLLRENYDVISVWISLHAVKLQMHHFNRKICQLVEPYINISSVLLVLVLYLTRSLHFDCNSDLSSFL